MINTVRSQLRNKDMRIMRDVAMLLLLCIPLSYAVTICTFKKIVGPPTIKKRPLWTVIVS